MSNRTLWRTHPAAFTLKNLYAVRYERRNPYRISFPICWLHINKLKNVLPHVVSIDMLGGIFEHFNVITTTSHQTNLNKQPPSFIPIQLDSNLVPGAEGKGKKRNAWCEHVRYFQKSTNGYLYLRCTKLCETVNFSRVEDAFHWTSSVWTTTKEQWKYSALHLQEPSTHLPIPAKTSATRRNDIIFSLKFAIASMKQCRLSMSKQCHFWLLIHL